jgi:hypothetical protein
MRNALLRDVKLCGKQNVTIVSEVPVASGYLEDGGRRLLRNICKGLPDYMELYLRREKKMKLFLYVTN